MSWHGPPARVEIRREGGRTTAVIHASVHPAVRTFLMGGLGLWGVGLLWSLRFLEASAGALPLFTWFGRLFLAGWVAVGLVVGHSVLFAFEGATELSSDGVAFVYRRAVRGVGRTRRFRREKVDGPKIRVDAAAAATLGDDTLVRLVFETTWGVHRVPESLRLADAREVAAALAPPVRPPAGRALALARP